MNTLQNIDETIRILAVDDEALNLEIIEHTLRKAGYEITCVSDGGQALLKLTAEPYNVDLILLDRMMPVMDGMEVLHRIKKTPSLQHIPVIMQTAASQADQVREGLQAGAYYYLTKPFSRQLLLEVITKAATDVLNTRRQRSVQTEGASQTFVYDIQNPLEAEHLALYLTSEHDLTDDQTEALQNLFLYTIATGNLNIETALHPFPIVECLPKVDAALALPEHQGLAVQVKITKTSNTLAFTLHYSGEGRTIGKGITQNANALLQTLTHDQTAKNIQCSVGLKPATIQQAPVTYTPAKTAEGW